ncbi:hypothetical protein EHQ53_13725 [Leptospira langatensis]|uniref:Uncharacterized protein n=1 Tax=Leptospira langatensis TaxID=2484983 RepID=A0A5F1ZRC1_9LEPT|nr:hypothetical protein [Leptospira langatensis]TGK02576.1 hypothetical protein EHO57_04390 [Leptospira langatensis]TGL40224.1 hypothetical protein EHQ53_13725 [Leptospira langatensis]
MFIGHYSVAFAAKKVEPKTPLWTTFLGVQFVDILFMIFIVFGIEGVRFVPGINEVNSYDLYFMPYTHSLVAGIVWAIIVAVFFRYTLLKSKSYSDSSKNKIAGLIGISVLSHYFLDLPMHNQDLPILFDSGPKIGFGLWNHKFLSIATEFVLTLIGLVLYFKATKPRPGFAGQYGMILFSGFLFLLVFVTPFMPPPQSIGEFSTSSLVGYILLIVLAGWLDSKRIPVGA